ncbi:MAG: vanadium-dependent haloperoxidase [Mesorhizobium sp.]|nr:vanadium-dependent haloperoxidase [Mesorhizobium sp.]
MNRLRGLAALGAMMVLLAGPAGAAGSDTRAAAVLQDWYGLVLQLVRHTPTYSPPVASRSFAYLGVGAYEALASGRPEMASLAGQLNGLQAVPERVPGVDYDEAVILQAVLSQGVRDFFGNTGPMGQRAMGVATERFSAAAHEGVSEAVIARSQDYGAALAAHILAWSEADGALPIVNMGFPLEYALGTQEGSWVPTSLVRQQQMPLLPGWGNVRPFAMAEGGACPLPAPPAYSEAAGSDFHREALEVYETGRDLTDEQRAIARFWSDDPMLSPTPPGHWIAIALQVFDRDSPDTALRAETLARLGVAMADSFIGCWHAKYEYDLLRPITYIRRHIDPDWEPVLITPPFPEYPSGHSTLSGAAATVLTAAFGEGFAFTDATHERDGLPARSFGSFHEAAEEAALSRLYGGIHFRAAIERGLEQGHCIGGHAVALSMAP